jgi:hypothetical protein
VKLELCMNVAKPPTFEVHKVEQLVKNINPVKLSSIVRCQNRNQVDNIQRRRDFWCSWVNTDTEAAEFGTCHKNRQI